MKTNLLRDFRVLLSGRFDGDIGDIVSAAREDGGNIGAYIWRHAHNRRDAARIAGGWPGWPTCHCVSDDCDEPATCTDDGGNPVCDECQEYACDAEGECHCATHSDKVETVTESCGAGNQMRNYSRMKPPEMPESNPEGEYALYWHTVGDDAHVVARFSSQEDAEQAVAAKDWPKPGDHTNYLCGYEAWQLVDGEWMPI